MASRPPDATWSNATHPKAPNTTHPKAPNATSPNPTLRTATPNAPSPEQQRPPTSVGEVFGTLGAVFTLVSSLAAGLLGIPIVIAVGPSLAMGARILTGETEPLTPVLPWPFWTSVALLLLPLPFILKKRWKLAGFASLPFALLPFVQLYRLYPLTLP